MSSYPFFIPEFVLCANSSLFSFKIANEPSEFRNYLVIPYLKTHEIFFQLNRYLITCGNFLLNLM